MNTNSDKTTINTVSKSQNIIISEPSTKSLLHQLSLAVSEKNKLESVLRTMDNGVYGIDWDGKISLFNKAAEEITGWKKEEVIGRYCQDVMQIKGKEGESVCENCPLAQSFASGETVCISLCYITGKDGAKIEVSSTYAPVRGVKNDLMSGIGVFRDLRKEKELERMKTDFVTMAAHELRTPITSLKGYLSVLLDEGHNFSDEQKLFLERCFISANRLETLTNNILSVAKIERGTLPIMLSTFIAQEMVQEAMGQVIKKAEEKKIQLLFNSKTSVPVELNADKEKIKEVLTNFISNAITYTPEGGKIIVKMSIQQDKLVLEVKDNGMGFSEDTKKHLFEKFYREHREGTPIQGTGLGLYIAKMIISMHHGNVFARSKGYNQGSSFGFKIPLRHF